MPAAHPSTARLIDPREAYPRPPFPRQAQDLPGGDDHLDPEPDHGADTYVGSGRMTGMRAVITGADSGIGRAVAIAFAREGADILVSYLSEHEDAEATRAVIESAGRRAILVPGDLQQEDVCRGLIDRAVRDLGGVDVLVNNAAFQERRDGIEDISTEEWERTLRTNLTATFLTCRAAVPVMEPGAAIINVSSIQASSPSPRLLAYATTKGALVTFSRGLALMLASRGIRVNVVAPGPVWTPLVAATTDPDELSRFGADTPLGRPAQPAELADTFVFLATPASGFVSGAVIPVTGGELFG
jgi:NAD(P)-dependent dehydrogenase (short-subunit alcohol dehydrogenase family)